MKKITLTFVAIALSVFSMRSQINLVVEAPLNNNTSGGNRAPNGTSNHASMRACYLVLQSELANIPSGTNITSLGFTLTTPATAPTSGNFTVYLQNTTDVAYSKGTSYPAALTGMLPYYASVMNIPTTGTTFVMLTLSTPFNYTGGGIYIAMDWASAGPFNAGAATYLGENAALPMPGGGGAVTFSATGAPTTMTLTNGRPSFLFGYTNSNTNDIWVIGAEAPGKICAPLNTPHNIKAYVKNISVGVKTSITVSLNVSGANAFNSSQTIPSLAAGQTTMVTFASFNPQVLGLNTISVSVASDQNNLNNSTVYSQSVTCDQWALNPSAGTFTANSVGFNTATGMIVTPFTNPVSSSMVGIRGAISSYTPSVGYPLCGALLSSAGVLLATTNTITLTSGMLGSFQTFTFSTPQALSASTQYYFGLVQIQASTAPGVFPFGTLGTYIQPQTLYLSTSIGGGALTSITANFGYFGLEAILDVPTSMMISSTPTSVCSGSCTTLTAPQGLSNIIWSTGTTISTITVCPPANNSYSVVGTSSIGCPATATISIPINPLPNITVSTNTNAICIGSSVSFTAAGGNSYLVNGIPSASVVTQAPTSDATYVITGTDGNGCVNTATIGFSVFSLTVAVPSNTAICKGKQVTLTVGPNNYGYTWLTGSGSIPFQNPTVTPSVTTTYTVIATDVNNCSQSNTVMVTVNPNPTVTATPSRSVICKGESVTITGGGANTYTWSTNSISTSITVSPVTNTTYVVTGATTAGCTQSVTLLQLVNPCTGIGEESENLLFSVYPNPNNGEFVISSDNSGRGRILEIYNMLGSLIRRTDMDSDRVEVNLSNECPGIYQLKVTENSRQIFVSKVLKQ